MILYNYSGLKERDTKIYNVGGYNIAGGFSVNFLVVVGPAFLLGIILGWLIGIPFGISFFNPLSPNFHLKWTLLWLGLGIVVGCILWYVQFQGYRLYQYLIAYLKPKRVYTNAFKTTEFQLTNIKVNTFIRNIL